MTIKNVTSVPESVKEMFTQNSDALRELLRNALEEGLEQQMDVVAHEAPGIELSAGALQCVNKNAQVGGTVRVVFEYDLPADPTAHNMI